MSFKDKLGDFISAGREAAAEADTLDNKNLRDILLLGVARFEQAAAHRDVDRVGQNDEQRNMAFQDDAELNSGGNELFAAGDPGRKLQDEEAQRRAAWPSSPVFDPNATAENRVFSDGVADTAPERDDNGNPVNQAIPPATPFPGSVDDPNKPGGPLDGKSQDPNAQGRTRSDAPGQSHGDPAGSNG